MYIQKTKQASGKTTIQISKTFRDPITKRGRKKTIKSFGTVILDSKEGKELLAKANRELDLMKEQNELIKGFSSYEEYLKSLSCRPIVKSLNFGYLPYMKIFKELKLNTIFTAIQKENQPNAKYPLSDMMFYQIIQRIFNPSSKFNMYTNDANNSFLHDFSFVNRNNIYTSMDVFANIKQDDIKELELAEKLLSKMNAEINSSKTNIDKLEDLKNKAQIIASSIDITKKQYSQNFEQVEKSIFKHLNKHINKIIPSRNISLAFYDCTTYYFESFDEGDFRQRGMSKDNKRAETQVVMGLLIDTDGIPISYKLFRGNMHELHTMEEVIDEVMKEYTINEIIVVADRGLNSKNNVSMLRRKGLNYIVGAKGNSVPKDLKEKSFDDGGWTITNAKESKYQSGYITQKRKVVDKETKEVHQELVIKKFDSVYRERELKKQELKVTKAIDKIQDQTKRAAAKSKSKYYTVEDGSKKEKLKYVMDESVIELEQEGFGYFYIITNRIDMPAKDIIKAYSGLYKIEESFRILKSNLKARPVFHFKERRIRTHFLTCYVALVMQRILEYKLKEEGIKISTHQIIDQLKDAKILHESYNTEIIIKMESSLIENEFINSIYDMDKFTKYGFMNQHEFKKIKSKFCTL